MNTLDNGTVPVWLLHPSAGALNEKQLAALERLFDGILPGDRDRGIPSAREAAAATFVSQLLAMTHEVYVEIPVWQTLYPRMLVALDNYSNGKYGRPVDSLDDTSLVELLVGLEGGSLQGLPADLDQKIMFTTLRRHCIQGCFADPRWGGNRDRIMWRALGYLQAPEDLYRE